MVAIEKLCRPAAFGDLVHMETKIDKNVRSALTARFEVDNSFRLDGHCKEMQRRVSWTCSLHGENKVNVYGEGDFFKVHVDTPSNKNMIASVVFIMNIDGSLEVTNPIGGKVMSYEACNTLAVFRSSYHHSINKIKSGKRVILRLTLSPWGMKPSDDDGDEDVSGLSDLLVEMDGKQHGFGYVCSNVYPFETAILAGADQVFWNAVRTKFPNRKILIQSIKDERVLEWYHDEQQYPYHAVGTISAMTRGRCWTPWGSNTRNQ